MSTFEEGFAAAESAAVGECAEMPQFLAVDFYSGAGGTTRGLLDAGGYVLAGIEKDETCRETYCRNNRNNTLDCADPSFLAMDMFPASADHPGGQQQEVWDRLNELIPHYRRMASDTPLLFAICAPCQSFTKFVQRRMTAGRTISRDQDQNLLAETLGFIAEFQPDMIISENVASIKRGQYKRVWNDFQEQLRSLGYVVGEDGICASRFGVAQQRRRTVLLAYKIGAGCESTFSLPVPFRDPEAPQLSVVEAIGGYPALQAGQMCADIPNHVCRNLTEVNQHRLMSVRPGEPNFGFAETSFGDLSLECHRKLAGKGKRGFGDVYTRMHPARPGPTITTRFHSVSNGRFGHYDEKQVRGLSLREGANLQSFRDDYVFYADGMDSIARMIGNAIPPKLSAFMARWLLGLWKDAGGSIGKLVGEQHGQ